MFVDSTELPAGKTVEADICIVGAGAAGITMARELAGSPKTVVILESGGFELDARTQMLYHGKNIGIPTFDLHVNRLRFFGGTTNHWTGHCRPLDRIDFQERDWVPYSGWPLSREELNPFYHRAQAICELGPSEYENLEFFTNRTGLPTLSLDKKKLKTAVYNQSPPTQFGKVYREELQRSSNVSIYLYANALELETDDNAAVVTGIKVACLDGPHFTVKAKQFVIATGGMENARLLLLSNRVSRHGLGNDRDLVGRYFMDHVLLRPGADISFSTPDINLRLYSDLQKVEGGMMFTILAASETLMRREKIGNFRIHLVSTSPVFNAPYGDVFSRIDKPRQEGNILSSGKNSRKSIALHLIAEPFPDPDSRIQLSASLDHFGQPRLEANWKLADADFYTARKALVMAAVEFGRLGLGRAYGEIFKRLEPDWPANLEAGRHHCGTTRMSDTPTAGVVDRNCRVHGVSNLYIAGSSVFPTIGYANPTLTIVALSLRLSKHLSNIPL